MKEIVEVIKAKLEGYDRRNKERNSSSKIDYLK